MDILPSTVASTSALPPEQPTNAETTAGQQLSSPSRTPLAPPPRPALADAWDVAQPLEEPNDLGVTGRRQKHQCIIPIKGEPCQICKARGRACTFDAPPIARMREPRPLNGGPNGGPPRGHDSVSPASASWHRSLPSSERPSSRSRSIYSQGTSQSRSGMMDDVLSLIRVAKTAPPPPSHPRTTAATISLLPSGGEADLHYITAQAFSDLTFSVENDHTAAQAGDVTFRQLSDDPSDPVFFVATPSLLYGTAAPAGERLWQAACAVLAHDAPQRLIELYLRQTQPALPILDDRNFGQTEPEALIAKGVSYGTLVSFLAHSTCYIAEIRPHHKALWRQVLLSLEDEYRRPTLQTIQLALITISSRPAINVGQNTIAMGRLISAGQLLGLHLDSSRWRISPTEQSVRNRVWWAIVISDKWRSAMYGRPSNVSLEDCSAPMPTSEEVDPTRAMTAEAKASLESFVAMCKLTVILDSILSNFFTVQAIAHPRPAAERLRKLEWIGIQLCALERDLPEQLVQPPGEAIAPTGIRSFQLCKMNVGLILHRLTSAALEAPTSAQQLASFSTGLRLVQSLVEFLERLSIPEYGQFWSPYCSYIISNAGALLLRIALTTKSVDTTSRTTSGVLFTRLVVSLTSSHHAAQWDVASLALDRIATLLHSLHGELPELVPLLQLFGPPNHANPPAPLARSQSQSLPTQSPVTTHSTAPPAFTPTMNGAAPPAEQLTSPLNYSDPFWWMQTEILPLPEHLEDLPDAFEDWGAGGAGEEIDVHLAAEEGEPNDEVAAFDLLRFLQGQGTN